jgi:DNA-binding transcriptional MerR regulator
MSVPPLPLGSVAKRFGVTQRQVRRLFERGLLPEPGRVGAYRVVPVDDLPQVEEALRRAGYIPAEAEAVAAC